MDQKSKKVWVRQSGVAKQQPAGQKSESTGSGQSKLLRLLTLDPHPGHAAPPRGSKWTDRPEEPAPAIGLWFPFLPPKSSLPGAKGTWSAHQFLDPLQHQIEDLLPHSVVALGRAAGSIFLSRYQLLRVEELPIPASSYPILCGGKVSSTQALGPLLLSSPT